MTVLGQIGLGFDPRGVVMVGLMLILFVASIGLGIAGFLMSTISQRLLRVAFGFSAASIATTLLCAGLPSVMFLGWIPLPASILGPIALAGFPGYIGALVSLVRLQRRGVGARS
ncbi:MAG: hypothetical protein AAFY08_12665 [Planctomycetota bacterium]